MYQAAIRAIPINFHTLSRGGCKHIFYGKKGVVPQYFVSDCRYLTGFEESVKVSSDFIFHCCNLLHYKCHKVNLKCAGSYIYPPDWIKIIKNATINLIINEDDRCF